MPSIYLSVRDNARILRDNVFQVGISSQGRDQIMTKTLQLLEDALAEAEKHGRVKAAMDAKEASDEGEDLLMVLSNMICGKG